MVLSLFRRAGSHLIALAAGTGYLLVAAGLVWLAYQSFSQYQHSFADANVDTRQDWRVLNNSVQILAHNGGAYSADIYQKYAHNRSGVRLDILRRGDFAKNEAVSLFAIKRPWETIINSDVSDLESLISLSGGEIIDMQAAYPIRSKFGALPTVSIKLDIEDNLRNCLGYSWVPNHSESALLGLYCNAGEALVLPEKVACSLDFLTFHRAGRFDIFGKAFAKAETQRGFCRESRVQNKRFKNGWIESAKPVALRL